MFSSTSISFGKTNSDMGVEVDTTEISLLPLEVLNDRACIFSRKCKTEAVHAGDTEGKFAGADYMESN